MAEEDRIQFGRDMDPTIYDEILANKRKDVVVIPAHDTVKEIPKGKKEGFDKEGFDRDE